MSSKGKQFMMMKYLKEITWLYLAPTPDLEVPGISFHLLPFFFCNSVSYQEHSTFLEKQYLYYKTM